MNDTKLINAVLNMRHYQKLYFQNRSPFCLREAKKFEKQVDSLLSEHSVPIVENKNQSNLFQ